AHEPALARAERLHLRKDLGAVLLGQIEPELGRLDPDRVEDALFSQDDAALGADELRGVRLDRRWVVELARDRTALAAEERLARDGLPRLEGVPRKRADALRDIADPLEAKLGPDAVERAEG